MLAKELAEQLMEHPDLDVSVSVDISEGESDWERRAFGEIIEVMNDQRALVLISVGETNEEMSRPRVGVKPRTLDTLRSLLWDLKIDALHAGRYPTPVDPDKWEQRDKKRAFQCLGYVSLVRRINALTDAIAELQRRGRHNGQT